MSIKQLVPKTVPKSAYVICCTPRSGSHLLSDLLLSSGLAGYPDERFPRFDKSAPLTAEQRASLVTEGMPESSFNEALDAAYVKSVIEDGTTSNGVFGICIHWIQVNDAMRRIKYYSKCSSSSFHDVLDSAFPNLSYIWLRRRDRIAQAVSWFKAIQTGQYVTLIDTPRTDRIAEPEFNYAKIREYWTALRSADNGWDYFFKSNNLRPLVLYYEELAQDPYAVANSVLKYLGICKENISLSAPRHVRVGDARSDEWIRSFKVEQSTSRR
jgi:LPS sulfotransferase NodH